MITDEAVAEFVSITNASPDEARGYLEMAGGELQGAMNLFLEMGGGPGAAAPSPAHGASPSPPRAAEADMDADGVRAPIAAYQDQIINPEMGRRRIEEAITADSVAMGRRMAFDRPHDVAGAGAGDEAVDADVGGQAINQLFAAPSYNENDPYYSVIEKAKNEGKWVLVNIQQAEVFASHTLNRDVWNDDTIRDVVQGSFLFWQRDDKSAEGDQFCQYYHCGHQLPHICVIDPRTKRCVKAWDGRKWCESHAAAEYLFTFLDEFCMSRSPPALSPAGSPGLKPQDPPGASEDVQMTGLDSAAPMESEPAEPEEPVATMPEEPAADVEHLKVSLRVPSGQRVTRRFLPTDQLEQMFLVASALAQRPPSCVELSTQFPKRSLRDLGLQVLLKDAEVAGSMVLINVRAA